MYSPIRDYDALLADIKRQLTRIKTELSPTQALEMGNEVQRHLNRVMADVQEQANATYDYDEMWAGSVYSQQGDHSL